MLPKPTIVGLIVDASTNGKLLLATTTIDVTAANVVKLLNGTNRQSLELYSTWSTVTTSGDSQEGIRLKTVASNNFELGSFVGTVSGSNRGISFGMYERATPTVLTKWAEFSSSGNFGVGTAGTVSAKTHIISTTEQLRIGLDTSSYYSTTVSSGGAVTFNAVGGSAGFTFSDAVTCSTSLAVTGATTLSGQVVIDDTLFIRTGSLYFDTYGAHHGIRNRRANGTLATPTQVISGDLLGFWSTFGCHDGGAFHNTGAAGIYMYASETFTTTAHGGNIRFLTAPIGSTTLTQRMIITDAGQVGIGTLAPSARVHAMHTTEQLRIGFNESNYYSTTVSSGGAVTFDAVGGSAGFTFSDGVTCSTSLAVTGATTLSGQTIIDDQLYIRNGNMYFDTYGTHAGMRSRRANGTFEAPEAVNENDLVGFWASQGYNGAAFHANWGCTLAMYAAEDYTSIAQGTTFRINTAAIGTTAAAMRLFIGDTGRVAIGGNNSTPSSMLQVVSTTEQLRVGYDASTNYFSTTVSSVGAVTFDAAGAIPSFTFSDTVTCSSNLNVTGNTLMTGYLTVDDQLFIRTGSLYFDTYAQNNGVRFRRANGTVATPTQVLSGEILGYFNAQGYWQNGASGGFHAVAAAAIQFYAAETFTDTACGGTLRLLTTPIGSTAPATRLFIGDSGLIGVGTTVPTNILDIATGNPRIRTARTPASATAAGNQGEICWDANYIYICTATNTWKRVAIATW